jgi:hypothetical protein
MTSRSGSVTRQWAINIQVHAFKCCDRLRQSSESACSPVSAPPAPHRDFVCPCPARCALAQVRRRWGWPRSRRHWPTSKGGGGGVRRHHSPPHRGREPICSGESHRRKLRSHLASQRAHHGGTRRSGRLTRLKVRVASGPPIPQSNPCACGRRRIGASRVSAEACSNLRASAALAPAGSTLARCVAGVASKAARETTATSTAAALTAAGKRGDVRNAASRYGWCCQSCGDRT